MNFIYNDGGRSKYFKGSARDCVTRAIAIATNEDYKVVYQKIKKIIKQTPRNGIPKKDTKKIMESFGFNWVPLMSIGSGCQTHLNTEELPKGTIICQVSGHVVCVKDGIIYDTFDCSRNGKRCVYGYWK